MDGGCDPGPCAPRANRSRLHVPGWFLQMRRQNFRQVGEATGVQWIDFDVGERWPSTRDFVFLSAQEYSCRVSAARLHTWR